MRSSVTEVARAKINLTLHVGRIIADPADPFYRYHPVDSLVVFADFGDKLTLRPAPKTTLHLCGPFGHGLAGEPSNLVLRALHAVYTHAAGSQHFDITLEKNLPIASGIGGGSADAAAMLRALSRFVDLTQADWHKIALGLGADVPVCWHSHTAHMTGIGEDVSAVPGLGQVAAVLVNPGVGVSTAQIYGDFDARADVRETPRPQLSTGGMLARARDGRNDLEPPASALAPDISAVLAALRAQPGCDLARMSGSGATCFGLFNSAAAALAAAAVLSGDAPDWWVKPCQFGDA